MRLFYSLCILLVLITFNLVMHFRTAQSSTQQLPSSRYVQVFVDPETGCNYLTTMDGGITPRLRIPKLGEPSHVGCEF